MKQKAFRFCLMFMALTMLPLMAGAKKIQMGQFVSYNGKVNGEGLPEGKGTLETTYGSFDLLKGVFDKGTVSEAELLFGTTDKKNFLAKFEGTLEWSIEPDGSKVIYILKKGIFISSDKLFYITERPLVIERIPSGNECKFRYSGYLNQYVAVKVGNSSASYEELTEQITKPIPARSFWPVIIEHGEVINHIECYKTTAYGLDANFSPQMKESYLLLKGGNGVYVTRQENVVSVIYSNGDYTCYEYGTGKIGAFRKSTNEGVVTYKGDSNMDYISSTNQKGIATFDVYPDMNYNYFGNSLKGAKSFSQLNIKAVAGEEAIKQAKAALSNPSELAKKIIQMIGNNNQPFSEVISLCDKLMALEKSDEQKKAIKRVINECHTMATGYDSETGYSRAYDHRGTERGKQELALAAKLQEYLIEGGDMDELVDYAYRCRQNRDTATAKKYFQQAADKGNAMAMRGLAFCYEDENNMEKAEEWYKKLLQTDASEQYCVDAMNFYRKANRSDKILEILELSAEKSKNRDAMLRLGDIYRNGKDWEFKKSGIKVAKNLATAMKWYKMAREAGSKAALFFMADCYWIGGTGVKQNRAEASKLYQKLMDEVGIFNLNISEAEADEKSKANYRMGYCYENGIGAVRNIPKAWDLYCNSHEADAYYRRGVMMEKRWVYERLRPDIRRQQVRQFYQTAANMGHKQAQQALNRMYR